MPRSVRAGRAVGNYLHQLGADAGYILQDLPVPMDDKDVLSERDSDKSVLSARLDDDDDDGYFKRQIKAIAYEITRTGLKRRIQKRETESLLIAVQNKDQLCQRKMDN